MDGSVIWPFQKPDTVMPQKLSLTLIAGLGLYEAFLASEQLD